MCCIWLFITTLNFHFISFFLIHSAYHIHFYRQKRSMKIQKRKAIKNASSWESQQSVSRLLYCIIAFILWWFRAYGQKLLSSFSYAPLKIVFIVDSHFEHAIMYIRIALHCICLAVKGGWTWIKLGITELWIIDACWW